MLLRVIGLILLQLLNAEAHLLDRLTIEAEVLENDLWLSYELDAGYGDPSIKADEYAEQPDRQWLVERTAEQQAAIQKELLAFSHRYLRFHQSDTSKATPKVQHTLPDWNHNPPQFPQWPDGKAYVRIKVRVAIPKAGQLVVSLGEQEDIPKTTIVFRKSEQQPDIIDILPGEQYVLIERSSEGTAKATDLPATAILFRGIQSGFLHVIPEGLDHVLFILTLCLIASSLKSLLYQSLIFTAAHSISFIVLGMGWVRLGASSLAAVEILIASSILFLALDNLRHSTINKQRALLITFFGIIHGLGFASSIGSNLDVQGTPLFTYLLSANIGIELAQICILAVAFAMLAPMPEKRRSQTRVLGSITIAVAAIAILAQRCLF